VRVLWILLGLAWAGPAAPDLPLGRDVRVSVADDHVFVQIRASAAPADRGRTSWSEFDRDGDGSLDARERVPLLEALRREECAYAALSVGELPIPVARFEVEALDVGERSALDATLVFRVHGRVALPPSPDGWPFVLYDRPRRWQGAVPIRLSVSRGLTIEGVQGARSEQRGPQRLDTVVSNSTPAVWGRIAR
jgi:hypothetical protein